MKLIPTTGALLLLSVFSAHAQTAAPLKLQRTIDLTGVKGKFDHFAYDETGQRLFAAAAGNHTLEVIDLEGGKVAQQITGLGKPHGVAWVAGSGRLFVADGSLAALKVYEGTPFKLIATLPLSEDADDMVYDSASKLLYVGHGGSSAAVPGRVAVVDTVRLNVVENLPMRAHPEALEIDPAGHRIFVNVADAAEVAVINGSTHKVTAQWPLTRAKDNVPLAYAGDAQRLILGCREPASVLLLDAGNGKEQTSLPSSSGADDLFYDADSHRAYVIAGSGAVDVLELRADKLEPLGRVETASGAKTGLLIPKLHTLVVGMPSTDGQPSRIALYTTAAPQ